MDFYSLSSFVETIILFMDFIYVLLLYLKAMNDVAGSLLTARKRVIKVRR